MSEFLLVVPKGARKNKKRIGRGSSSGTGCTAGKGNKGQNCRSGGGVRPGFEGGQMPLYRRIARRGFSNYPFKKEYLILNVDDLEKYKSGDTVSKKTLLEKGIIAKKNLPIKLLGRGEIKKKLIIELDKVSKQAKDKIVGQGGEVKILSTEKAEKKQAAASKKQPQKKQAAPSPKQQQKAQAASVQKEKQKQPETKAETIVETKAEVKKSEKPASEAVAKTVKPKQKQPAPEATILMEEEKPAKKFPSRMRKR